MFSDANITPELGAELMQIMGLSALDIQTPDVYEKYRDIAEYFSKFQDAAMVARVVTRHATLKDKLDKVWGYVHLRKSLDDVRRRKSELPLDDMASSDDAARQQIEREEALLIKELQIYER